MKNKLYAFVIFSVAILAIAPVINTSRMINNHAPLPKLKSWKKEMYNMDFAAEPISLIKYFFGVSSDPQEVIIGKDGWLFLGDNFVQTITSNRRGVTALDGPDVDQVASSAQAWTQWFKENGIGVYRIVIGPDKSTAYPEMLPRWASPSSHSFIDAVISKGDSETFVYPKAELLETKNRTVLPLYFKTDTHWNMIGAWIAFDKLTKNLQKTHEELLFPKELDLKNISSTSFGGGDLSNFLRLRKYLPDVYLRSMDKSIEELPVQQYSYQDMKLLSSGGNTEVGAPEIPTLVRSDNALNHKRVLWLRDSFGSSMSPFMSATFSEILEIHHERVSSMGISDLVGKFKPDYVIVTCVERNARIGYMVSRPPSKL